VADETYMLGGYSLALMSMATYESSPLFWNDTSIAVEEPT
jgi:hypothetical protein